MTALQQRLAGGVWGHLVGDAVGVPYEFRSAGQIGEVRFGATGTHGQPPGTWSDDGALMLALLDSLTSDGVGFDLEDQGRRAIAWQRDGAYTPDRDGVFDIGGTTSAALRAIASGVPAGEAGPTGERDCGNGSLMRILPLALVGHGLDAATLVDRAMRASCVTHGHPRAQVACALYALVASRLLAGERDRDEALATAREDLGAALDGDATRLEALDHLLGWTDRAGRGSAWDAFWSAWDAFASAHDYQTTIQRAVAYGNDTDTTAAIAGGLAGIYWTVDGIPPDWLAGMRGRDIVDPLVDRLVASDMSGAIRVDHVKAYTGGWLGMTFTPGKRDQGLRGSHWRDLDADIATLRDDCRITTFVWLIEDHELPMLHVERLPEAMATAGLELVRYPIVDVGVPPDAASFRIFLDDLHDRLARGERVAVACRGGCGRTGTVVGCLLRDQGLGPQAAIDATRVARGCAIEVPEQAQFVQNWERAA